MAPRPRCPVCRSRRWHRDALSGSIVCEEGHLLAGYVQESTEQDYASQHVQQTRRERKNKGKKEKLPTNDYFHGDRATFLVWQCMQLILREQMRILIDEMGWPVELEAITRDLWTLLVSSSRIPPAPMDYEKGEEKATSYSGPRAGDRYPHRGRKKYGRRGATKIKKQEDAMDEDEPPDDVDNSGVRDDVGGETTDGGRGSESSEGESSPSSYFSDADDERPRPNGKSRPGSPSISTAPSPGSNPLNEPAIPDLNPYATPKLRPPVRGLSRRHPEDPRSHPRMDYLLYIIYLACITLRLPVFLSDIFHLAETYQIPYLDAVMHLPLDMQVHLSQSNRALLSPVAVPHLYPTSPIAVDQSSAQAWLARLVRMYREDWEIEFSEANFPLISGRLCRLLALPPIASVLVHRLLSLLPQPFSFYLPTHLTSKPSRSFSPRNAALAASSRREKGLPREFSWSSRLADTKQDWRMILPELKVASVIVVVVKLLFGLENENEKGLSTSFFQEYPQKLPDTEKWVETVEAISKLEKPGDLSRLWSQDASELEGSEIDAYLDFFESNIVSKTKVPKRLEDLGRFFPEPAVSPSTLSHPTVESYLSRLDTLTSSLYSSSRTPSKSHPSLPTDYPSFPSAHSSDALPTPLSRVLVALSLHILPLPTSLPISLQGPAPTLETSALSYFLPQITLVERLLSIRSVPLQKALAIETRNEERKLWGETKALAREFVKDQWDKQKARRKQIDRDAEEKRKEGVRERKRMREMRGKGVKTKKEIGESSEEDIEKEIREEMFKSRSVIGSSEDESDEDTGGSGSGLNEEEDASMDRTEADEEEDEDEDQEEDGMSFGSE